MKRLRDESGQVIWLAAMCMTVLLGMVAFATDVGLLFRAREVMQTAADSAALAGASELSNGNLAYITSQARADAAQNGVTHGVNGAIVTVNNPPTSGPNAGSTGYVEVIASQPQQSIFMRMFSQNLVTVAARAVATSVPSPNCIYTLGSTGTDINMTGSGNLTLPNCSILDNSSDSKALNLTGSGSISAKSIGIVGNYHKTGSGTISPTPVISMSAVGNPLSPVAPSFVAGSCNPGISYSGSTSHTVTGPSTPGGTICYNGFSNTGSGSVTFPAGTYIINGNFSTTGSGNLSGTGVTFYLPPGSNSFSVNGSGDLNFTAPTSGAYSGLLFYQDPGDTATASFTGSSSSTLSGIFYLPTAQVSMTGSGGGTFNTDIVVGSLSITGSLSLSDYAPPGGASPLASPGLAE